MHTLTEERIGLAQRLSKVGEFIKLISKEETEWKAIVEMQNTLDEKSCMNYLAELDRRGFSVCNAPLEQRVEAFISIKLKR